MIYTRAGIPGTRAGTPDCRGASSESLRLVKPKLPKMHSGEFSRKIQKKRPRAEKLSEHKKTEITAIGRCSCIYIYKYVVSFFVDEDGRWSRACARVKHCTSCCIHIKTLSKLTSCVFWRVCGGSLGYLVMSSVCSQAMARRSSALSLALAPFLHGTACLPEPPQDE